MVIVLDMKTQMPVPVLRSPHHLMAAIPFLLGFRPQCSIVLVWIDSGSIALTQRVDWPAAGAHDGLKEWATTVVHAARHVSAQAVVLVGYPDGAEPAVTTPDGAPVAALAAAVADAQFDVLDAIVVLDDSWCVLEAGDGGRLGPPLAFDLRITAEVSDDFMYSGWSFAADRAEVCAEFAAGDQAAAADRSELEALTAERRALSDSQRESWRDDSVRLVLASCERGALLEASPARLASGLTDIRVRDAVLWHLAHELDPQSSLHALRALVRALPEGSRAPSATMAAICAWLAGDGVRASAALEIAIHDEPDYGLAALVATALANGLPPRMWQETMEHLSYEACRHGLR